MVMETETQTYKPSDLKLCECGHLAHRHPTKKAPASQWRDKCSDCACRRFRVAINKNVDGKWVPEVKTVSGKTYRQEEAEFNRKNFEEWLSKSITPRKEWFTDTFVPRRIWP